MLSALSPKSLALLVLAVCLAVPVQAGGRSTPRRTATVVKQHDWVAGLIVQFKSAKANNQFAQSSMSAGQLGAEHAQKVSMAAAQLGSTTSYVRRLATGAELYRLGRPLSIPAAMRLARSVARQNADIDYAEPDVINHIMAVTSPGLVPSDPMYYLQWDMNELLGGMNVQNAWDITRGKGAVVAVLDTGVRPHEDLAANLLPGYDFVTDMSAANDGDGRDADATDPGDDCGSGSSWHGTHVSGTIAAVHGNGVGISGVAPEAKIVPVRVLGKCGGTTSDIIDGMVWAAGGTVEAVPANANPAKILNMSLGSALPCLNSYRDAVKKVSALGALVVAAAGNASQNARDAQPASCPGVFAVAANNREGGRAYYSNYGAVVAITAPGGETANPQDGILSTLNDGFSDPGKDNYDYYQGTSMATPHIAGLAALMLSVNPSLTPAKIRSLIMSTARAFPVACAACGAGIADAYSAVKAALPAK